MKNLSLVLLGAAVAAIAILSTSARGPLAPQAGMELRAGGSVFGLNLVKGTGDPLSGLTSNTPVKIRDVKGDWVQVDFPSMKTGPVWLNMNNIVSYRTGR